MDRAESIGAVLDGSRNPRILHPHCQAQLTFSGPIRSWSPTHIKHPSSMISLTYINSFRLILAWYSCLFLKTSKSKAISQAKASTFYDLFDTELSFQAQFGLGVVNIPSLFGTGSPEPSRPNWACIHQHFECNLERNSYCSNWTFINFSLDNNDPSFASPETILHILIPAFLHRHLQDTFEHNCVNRHFWDSI